MMAIIGDRGHCGPRLRPEIEITAGADDALAAGDRTDMALAHRAHRHHDTLLALGETRLVGMRSNAWIHERCGGITIFVHEIGAAHTTRSEEGRDGDKRVSQCRN